jgi:hypothetical protein
MSIQEVTRNKLNNLSEPLLEEVNAFIDKLWSKQLAEAAQDALEDYQNDPELIAFTSLDGEDFYDSDFHV